MMKKIVWISLVASIVLLLPLSAYAFLGNQMVNGNFEDIEDITHDYEMYISDPEAEGTVLEFVTEDANTFVRMGSNAPNYISLRQQVFLKANTTYEFGAKVKAVNLGVQNTGGWLRLDDDMGKTIEIKGTVQDWQGINFYITTADNDLYTSLEIGFGDYYSPNTGTFIVDDIYLVERETVPTNAYHYTQSGTTTSVQPTQMPTQTTPAVTPALLSAKDRLAIILLLFATVLFMILNTWFASHTRDIISKEKFTGRLQHMIIAIGFVVIILYKYYLASLGTDLASDIGAYIKWSNSLTADGLKYFYPNTGCNYPCGYMYVLWAIGNIAKVFGLATSSTAFNLMLKTPVIFAEVLTALLAYRVAKRHLGDRNGLIMAFIILLNPAMLINTSSWGQIDAVFVLAVVLVFYLLEQKHLYFAAAAFAIAFLIKTQAILFFPVFGAYYLQLFLRNKPVGKNIKDFAISIAIAVATFIIISIPFMADNGILWQFKQIGGAANYFGYTSLNGFNFYTLFGGNYAPVNDKFMLLTYQTWGYIFIVIASLVCVVLVFINRKKQNLYLIAALMLGAVFTFGHGMHERYILPLPLLLFFAYIFIKDRRIINAAILYTIFALLSQAAVLFFFGAPYYKAIVLFMSLFSLFSFGYLLYLCYVLLLKTGATIKRFDQNRPEETKRKAKDMFVRLKAQLIRQPIRELHVKTNIVCINKHDRLIILTMCVIYALMAFTNLGTLTIANSAWQPKVDYEEVIIELEDVTKIDTIKYYFGAGETQVNFKASNDGDTYFDINLPADPEAKLTIKHVSAKMYAWQFVDVDFEAKYIAMEFTSENIDVREIGFVNTLGDIAQIKSLSSLISSQQELLPLTDEQDRIPKQIRYVDGMYFDEIYHARTALEQIEHRSVYEITHPPLGKTLLSIGIRIFGMTPFGWRFMGTLFGVLMLPLLYILAKRLTKRTIFAIIATFLLMFDFMHFTQTRMATIDSYSVLFILCMFLFMYDYLSMNFNRDKLYKTFAPLGLSGLFFGLGTATKWLCLYAGLGLAIIFFYSMIKRYTEFRAAKISLQENTAGQYSTYYKKIVDTYYYKLAFTLIYCIIVFILVPALIYYLSYIPYMRLENNPYTFKQIIANQTYMFNYHTHLDTTANPHPFASRWYSWIFNLRPVYLFQGTGFSAEKLSSLSTFGNPAVWWALVPSVVILIIAKVNKTSYKGALGFAAFAGLANFVPWILITRETYIYHYFASVPFVILIVTFAIKYLWDRFKYAKFIILAYLLLVLVLFILFYPFITGIPVSREYAQAMRWLETWPFY